jgi:very-short-patch-repair endonuclease
VDRAGYLHRKLPLPALNVTVEGFLVDAVWRVERLVVEVDGAQARATPARMNRDRERDLALRRAGCTVHRSSWWQVTDDAELVAADLRAALSSTARWDGSGSR